MFEKGCPRSDLPPVDPCSHAAIALSSEGNIGHNWQFNNQQQQELQRYYDANRFLVKLIKIEGAVSHAVRTEIEDSLLLPWDELQRRYPDIYSS